ncbi:unnamed protein product [Trichogramma brassicae]|uniref:Uncharacterized protein n=1 Tax=Trichogramma brassicae TaxID=86971 RepID=A0A6H5HVK0_9HYME|nr:unnamed protein product [Trichogramma brassicae]
MGKTCHRANHLEPDRNRTMTTRATDRTEPPNYALVQGQACVDDTGVPTTTFRVPTGLASEASST